MPRLRDKVIKPRHRKLNEVKRPGQDRMLATAGLLLCSFSIVWCCGVALRLIFFFYHISMKREMALGTALLAWVFLFIIGRMFFLRPAQDAKAA